MVSKLGRKWKRNVKDKVRNFLSLAEENAAGKAKTIPVFSLWSLVFGRIFIPVTIIEPKTNCQRPKTNEKVFTEMQYLSFADLIQCNGALKRTFESGNIRISGFGVFLTNPAVYTLAP